VASNRCRSRGRFDAASWPLQEARSPLVPAAPRKGRGTLWGTAIGSIHGQDYQLGFEPMLSFPIRLLGLEPWPPCGGAAVLRPAHRRFHIRHAIGGVFAFIAVTSCGYAVSQERAPEATSHSTGPLHSGSPSGPSHETLSAAAPDVSEKPASSSASVDEVKAYLWSVYQRSPTKADGHGDFTWKDVSAAGRAGLSVEDYVIGGIDPDFAELLFAAGHAMDAAGVGWTILSGFRDDFRQNLAAGLKARVNNSFHGGSEATGGYRHGCAVDLASVDRLSDDKVWGWVDRKGREFDLNRPLRAADPAHTLPMAGWHEVAAVLRNKRLGTSAEADPAPLGNLVTLEQYLCIRPLPPENAPAGAQVADSGRHTTGNWAATHVPRHDTKGNGAPRKPNGVRDNETKQSAATMRAASKR
jgi:hypothetical protein